MRKALRRRWVLLVVVALLLGLVAVLGRTSPRLTPVGQTISVSTDRATVGGGATLSTVAGSMSNQVVRFADEATTAAASTSGFEHPGILMDRDQLDYVKAQVALGNQPWADAFTKAMTQRDYAARTPHLTDMQRAGATSLPCDPANPGSGCIVNCGAYNSPNDGCGDETADFMAANTQALLWYLTGDEAYARSAVAILNAWSAVLVNHTGSNAALQASWSAESVVRAAEILRYTYTPGPGEAALDVPAFTRMLDTAFRPAIDNGSYAKKNGNWDLAAADALMNIAVFNDDRPLFDRAVDRWRARVPAYIYLRSDGAVPVAPPSSGITTPSQITCYWLNNASNCTKATTKFENGQSQETCRDTSHASMGLASLFDSAETARVQGVDLYSGQLDRMAAGLEYLSRLTNTVTAVSQYAADFCLGHGTLQPPILEPTFEVAYNALANRHGIALPETAALLPRLRGPTVVSSNRMMASEALTHAGTGNRCGDPANRYGKAYLGTEVGAAADYRVWVRVKTPEDSSGSLSLQVDGGCPSRLGLDQAPPGEWTWVNTTAGDDGRPLTQSLSEGKHLFTVTPGGEGVLVDQVLLTDDPDCVPDVGGCPVTPVDTTVPTAPDALTVDAVTETTVSLSWQPSTDDHAVRLYRILRDGLAVGTSTEPSFTDRRLTPGTTFSYSVLAIDKAGNESAPSVAVGATTDEAVDTQPPSAPSDVSASGVTSTAATLTWSPATDDSRVDHYVVRRDGADVAFPTEPTVDDSGLLPATSYEYTVLAVDAAGNPSTPSQPLSVTTRPPPPPAPPTGLVATNVTDTGLTLAWTAPTGTPSADHYVVRRDGASVGTVADTTYSDLGLQPATAYRYSVLAVAATGASSLPGEPVDVTTKLPPDRTPPSTPGTVSARVTALGQVAVSWGASTDNVGVSGYRLTRNGAPLATQTGTTYTDSGLAPGTAYTYSVTAYDAAGNVSAPTTGAVTTPLATAPLGAGFAGAYFNNTTLSGPAIGRLDPSLSFAWGTGSPMPGIGADKFSARWTGLLTAPRSGTYTFYVQGDNGARLYLNDKLLIDTWSKTNAAASATSSLTAGTSYNLRVEYYENTGSASMKLQWSGPGVTKAVLPSSVVSSGSRGLSAAYFTGLEPTGTPTLLRQDSAVNFAWGTGSPDSRLPGDGFSTVWTGKLTAPVTGPHTVYTDTDDGVRVWVDNVLVIDNWSGTGLTARSATLILAAKSVHDLRVAYQERTSSATAKLSWSYGTQGKTVIPTTALRDR